jgi:UDP-glucose 6-dehydrogenase
MKIGVVGAGHIGSVIAAELAHRNNDVIAIDVDSSKVGKINSGISPISEPGLADLISKVVAEKRLSATTEFSQLVNCELIIITVGTPYINGSADLSALKESARLIGLNASL